jgi:enamine deaminase RidA (YjgF/YER057c/UK114 family)
MGRQNISYGKPLESQIGFSRAVRVGNLILVSGTAPIAKDGSACAPGNAYAQAKRCLEIICDVLGKAGAGMKDVVRTRVYLKNISDWQAVAKAHSDSFSRVRPACTFVEVSGFVNPEWLVEIEADAAVAD